MGLAPGDGTIVMSSRILNTEMLKWLRLCCTPKEKQIYLGSGCGSDGRAVASDARGPQFELSHRQTFISDIYLFTVN